jgi:hypothetical protein
LPSALSLLFSWGTASAAAEGKYNCGASDHLSERWDRFSWFGTDWVTQTQALAKGAAEVKVTIEAALNILEAVSIAISEPRLNLQRGHWSEATQYFQFKQDEEEEEEEEE